MGAASFAQLRYGGEPLEKQKRKSFMLPEGNIHH
jgi:hypothetical protein